MSSKLDPASRAELDRMLGGGLVDEASVGSDFNLAEYVGILRRRWKLIVLCALIGAIIGAIQYSNTPRVYQAKSRIQIERRTLNPLGTGSSWLDAWWNPEYYPTQYEILKSRGLAERVILSLRLWEDPAFSPGAVPGADSEGPIADSARMGKLASRLMGGLSIRPQSGTQLVDILYRSQNPDLAMRLANGYAEAYRQRGVQDRSMAVSRASDFLGLQIEEIKREIEEKETQLHNFRRSADFLTLDEDSNTALQRVEAVNQEYIEARSERIQGEVRYNELLSTSNESLAETLVDPQISALRSEKARLEREYASKLEVYRPDWPAMQELKLQVDDKRRELSDAIDEARDAARARYQTAMRAERRLEQELEAMKEQTLTLNSSAVDYNNLKVEVATRRQLLDELVRRQSETSVAMRGSSEPNVHIVERALLPSRPSEPNLKKKVTTNAGFGVLAGLALIFLLEFLDRSIKTPDELEKRLRRPVLGVIPDVSVGDRHGYFRKYGLAPAGYGYGYGRRKRKQLSGGGAIIAETGEKAVELIPQRRPRLAVSESYRSFRTALLLSTAEELKVVSITSATSGEGKTATACNLATVMAQLGRRVLLIDADLRKPRIHQVFRISNRIGVVNYLVGQAELEDICISNGVPNLRVAPSGPIPPNPSELLASERMRHMVEQVRSWFDFIVIDTPPTLAVTDSTIMGNISDGLVLCVRAGHIPREDARLCAERLTMAGVKILGTILNCYRPFSGRYSRDSYYYYYYQAYAEDADHTAGNAAS